MADWGLKVSREGKSISSSEPRDFVFNSSNPENTKILIRGGTTITINAGADGDVSVTHNFGYKPLCIVYIEQVPGSGNWYMGCAAYGPLTEATIKTDWDYTYVDNTYLKFRIHNGFGSQKTISFYYYIFGDQANA